MPLLLLWCQPTILGHLKSALHFHYLIWGQGLLILCLHMCTHVSTCVCMWEKFEGLTCVNPLIVILHETSHCNQARCIIISILQTEKEFCGRLSNLFKVRFPKEQILIEKTFILQYYNKNYFLKSILSNISFLGIMHFNIIKISF